MPQHLTGHLKCFQWNPLKSFNLPTGHGFKPLSSNKRLSWISYFPRGYRVRVLYGEFEADGYTEALHAQMFLCDADVAAAHANDTAVHAF